MSPFSYSVFFSCNSCLFPISAIGEFKHDRFNDHSGDLRGLLRNYRSLTVFPKTDSNSAPSNLPSNIEKAFIQAEDAIKRGHWEAAGAMDRRALELATKEMAPERSSDS